MKDGRITREEILARLADRVIIMDGAMGTMLQKHCTCVHSPEFDIAENPCLLNLTDPGKVAQIHRSYIQSGAELIETNTFNSAAIAHTAIGISVDEGKDRCSVYEINRAGAEIAFRVAVEECLGFMLGDEDCSAWKEEWGPRRAIVAGSIAATSRITSDYTQIAEGLLDGGVDVLLLESIYDLANAEVALKEIRKVIGKRTVEIPVMVSVTIDREGKILSGEDFRTVFGRLEKYGIFSLGFNCSMGAGMMIPLAIDLSEFAEEYPVSICPSAGLPDRNGQYPEGPEFWASCFFGMRYTFNFAGGCCGTTPEHIKALKDSFKQYKCSH